MGGDGSAGSLLFRGDSVAGRRWEGSLCKVLLLDLEVSTPPLEGGLPDPEPIDLSEATLSRSVRVIEGALVRP
jgi:hypothetical protein